MPEVFELTIDPGRRFSSTFASSCCLISSRSTTASMIQSVLAIRSRCVSKPPVVTSLKASGVNCGSGFSLRAFSSPCLAASAVRSSSSAGMPALAQCSAICAPIVPAPSTVTELIPIGVICAFCGSPAFHSVDEEVDDRVRFGVEVVLAAAQHPVGGHLVESAKKIFVAVVALMSLRNAPLCWPSAIAWRISLK